MNKITKLAIAYLNCHEVTNNQTLKTLMGIDPAKTPWCAYFVYAILRKCGFNFKTKGTARSLLKVGKPVKLEDAREGDIVVLKRGWLPWQGHVGLYAGKNGDNIRLLGGNQSNKVCYKWYKLKKLLGIRRVE